MKTNPSGCDAAVERRDAGRQTRSFALSLKSVSDDGLIEGYGSVFGVRDSYSDIVAPGAFKASLAAHKVAGTMPALLWQHDASEPIGIWIEMTEDQRGLRIKGRLAMETARGKEAHTLLKMGAINGLSIGFLTKDFRYDRQTDIRTVTELELWEVSLVTFPSNSAARVTSVRSADEIGTPKDAERVLRDAGFSRADATAFVSRLIKMGLDRREATDATAQVIKAAQRLRELIKETT